MTPTLDYRRKELAHPDFGLISDPPIADLYFTLRVLFVAACIYLVWGHDRTFTLPIGPIMYFGAHDDGFLLMFLDRRYASRLSLNGALQSQVIPSILASSTSGTWPYASWLLIPHPLFVPLFILVMAIFWRLTRYRLKQLIAHRT